MKKYLFPYELKPVNGSEPRRGFLLKLQDQDDCCGYADIFPWVHLGDPDWSLIPEMLKKNEKQLLPLRSVEMASKDLIARKNFASLLGDESLQNHYPIPELNDSSRDEIDRAFEKGFKKIKIKIGRSPGLEKSFFESLPGDFPEKSLRLDGNLKLKEKDWEFLSQWKDKIEFIEDPFPEACSWKSNENIFAYDQPGFDSGEVNCLWQIVKPARQKASSAKKANLVFTSYLDHPVGIAHAFAEAQNWGKQRLPYGLASHHVYEEDSFHEYFIMNEDWLKIERDGFGIGFEKILSRLNWIPVEDVCGME